MDNTINRRIEALRSIMRRDGIDAVIIPHTDPHQSEYLAEHWHVRPWISGFTGSAGTIVVTTGDAALWVDSRYYLQGADQLRGSDIKLMRIAMPDTPEISDWLISILPADAMVGIDGMLFSKSETERLIKQLGSSAIKVSTDYDVIDSIWIDRPPLPKGKIYSHDIKYTGETAAQKIASVMNRAEEQGANAMLVTALDEIAWILNIRCDDVRYNPVATAYLYLSVDPDTDSGYQGILFIDPDKVDTDMTDTLAADNISIRPYSDIKMRLKSLPDNAHIYADPGHTSTTIASLLGNKAVYGMSLIAVPKAIRNQTQIAGVRQAMVRDGVAMVKAFRKLEQMMAAAERVSEKTVEALLLKYRREQPLFVDESFGTIAGYGPHGAIVHYEATDESDVEIKPNGLLLVDSGAQYLDGTTDITRTFAMGKPTPAEKHDFTLVMKGHIALASMIFPVGTRGAQLDVEARKFLWREGLGYLHGTGHGVGHFLNVHEGPQTIRMNDTPTPLMEGMVTSNEPGLYRTDIHGVRCENLVLCVKAMTTEFGEFLKFETITLFPFDLSLFETEIMSSDEIDWVNNYHRKVYESLAPHLTDDERQWLAAKTQPLTK